MHLKDRREIITNKTDRQISSKFIKREREREGGREGERAIYGQTGDVVNNLSNGQGSGQFSNGHFP